MLLTMSGRWDFRFDRIERRKSERWLDYLRKRLGRRAISKLLFYDWRREIERPETRIDFLHCSGEGAVCKDCWRTRDQETQVRQVAMKTRTWDNDADDVSSATAPPHALQRGGGSDDGVLRTWAFGRWCESLASSLSRSTFRRPVRIPLACTNCRRTANKQRRFAEFEFRANAGKTHWRSLLSNMVDQNSSNFGVCRIFGRAIWIPGESTQGGKPS